MQLVPTHLLNKNWESVKLQIYDGGVSEPGNQAKMNQSDAVKEILSSICNV